MNLYPLVATDGIQLTETRDDKIGMSPGLSSKKPERLFIGK